MNDTCRTDPDRPWPGQRWSHTDHDVVDVDPHEYADPPEDKP